MNTYLYVLIKYLIIYLSKLFNYGINLRDPKVIKYFFFVIATYLTSYIKFSFYLYLMFNLFRFPIF